MKGQKDEIETAKREKEDCIQTNSNVSYLFLSQERQHSQEQSHRMLGSLGCVFLCYVLFCLVPVTSSFHFYLWYREKQRARGSARRKPP